MSHFTRVRTKITDKKILQECLVNLGYQVDENTAIKGYHGAREVEMRAKMPAGYDIGFVRAPEGYYEIIADWWGVKGTNSTEFSLALEQEFEEINKRIRQKYAVSKVLVELKQQGFQVVDQSREIDGTVKILARRWQ